MSKELKKVTIYTDGGCIRNPGPGGYGVVLLYGKRRKELSGGFRHTTNNRMEIMAAIVGLRALKTRCAVTVWWQPSKTDPCHQLGFSIASALSHPDRA